MYTIKELADLSGVSTRTLRYYDNIDLLKPHTLTDAGYRKYSTVEVERLQQILFYRALDFSLQEIKHLLDEDDYSVKNALLNQKHQLLQKRKQLDKLLHHIEQTISYYEGEIEMTDHEKFEAFKQAKLEENEQLYGEAIRARYGEKAVESSNQNWQHLSEADYDRAVAAEERLISELNYLLEHRISDLNDSHAERAFLAHREWLEIMAPFYSKDYHRSLGEMYIADHRFANYYNNRTEQDSVELLKAIINQWTN
ncbi:MerR family transcriptional regulator [Macrococcus hajekii]|nr:MerR family transcriptional regulator [Macrococcus hajekii]GGB06781.1 MerR family transcriptional regulator [Macrococcus hajekii]